MKNIIFDGKNYYLFRALNDGNKKDFENGINTIRTDCVRYYEEHGTWGKYSDKSEISLEEIYDHIKMRYRRDTNCISLTRDANVALTYHNENPKYVLVEVSPEQLEKVVDAGEYLSKVIQQRVLETEKNVEPNSEIGEVLNQIENATSINEIKNILNKFNPTLSTYTVNDRQYLSDDEQIKISRINAKLKILENSGLIGNIIENVPNAQLLATMGNAYTSCEHIYYGDIPREITIDCPREFIEIFSLLQQARQNGVPSEEIDRISSKVLELVQAGYSINEQNNTFSNKENEIYVNEQDLQFLIRDYSSKQKLRKDLNIDKAYELTRGRIGYNETNMQLVAIRSLAEMLLKKKALVEILKKVLPEEKDIERILENTYCINPELVIKQNGRGHQLSSTVNLLISEYGYDLKQEDTRILLENVSRLTQEQLLEIYNQGIETEGISKLLVQTRTEDDRIQARKGIDNKTKYFTEAIIEGYNWKKTRALTKTEKDKLARKISINKISGEDLKRLYNELNKMIVSDSKFSQDEIFAIIINMAIDGKIGDVIYSSLLHKSSEEINKILWQNKDELDIVVNPVSLDLMMNRGKTIADLKKYYNDLGLESFIGEESDEQKDIKSLYIARQIVEEYSSEEKLSEEEKCGLLNCILNKGHLNKKRSRHLQNLYNILSKNGLSNQDINRAIIFLAINGGLGIEGYAYSTIIDTPSRMLGITFDINVSKMRFERAVSENLSEKYQEKLRKELEQIGVDKNYLKNTDIRNLYMAKRIVEGYHFSKPLSDDEKKAIINNMIKTPQLNANYDEIQYLSSLCCEFEKKGLTQHETYGAIINLSINPSEKSGYSYTQLLQNYSKIQELIKKEIDSNVSDIDIKKLLSKNVTQEDINELNEYYKKLGLEQYLQEENESTKKSIENLYIAKEIIEGYQFSRTIDIREKKAILDSILKNKNLDNGRKNYLSTLCQKLEKMGLTQQEVYGAVINLSINGYFTELTGYDYSKMLRTPEKVQELKKEDIQCDVGEFIIQKAVQNNLSDREKAEIKEYFVNLGLEDFVNENSSNLKNLNNLFTVRQIVEDAYFDTPLNIAEKRAIAFGILKSNDFDERNNRYINTICQQFEKLGLSKQEVYGAMMNLGINGSATKEVGYTLPKLIHSPLKIQELKKDDICTKVTRMTILRALSECLSKPDEEKLKEQFKSIGINQESIDQKSIENLYFSEHILDNYNFYRQLSTEERKEILTCIISNNRLNSGKNYLCNICRSLEEIGLTEQEIYGSIINLSINGIIVQCKGFDYTTLISAPSKVQGLKEYKAELDTTVNEETIRNAQAKAKKIMKKTVKQIKEQGRIQDIPSTMMELENMAKLELTKDNPNSTQELSK